MNKQMVTYDYWKRILAFKEYDKTFPVILEIKKQKQCQVIYCLALSKLCRGMSRGAGRGGV